MKKQLLIIVFPIIAGLISGSCGSKSASVVSLSGAGTGAVTQTSTPTATATPTATPAPTATATPNPAPVLASATISNLNPSNTRTYSLSFGSVTGAYASYCILENDTDVNNCSFTGGALPATFFVSTTENAKVLSVWLKNAEGSVSERVDTNSVPLDTTAPALASATITTSDPSSTRTYALSYGTVTGAYASYCILENDSNVSNCTFTDGGLPTTFTVSATENEKVLSIWLRDTALNVSIRAATNPVTLDMSPPILASVTIDNASPSATRSYSLSYGELTGAYNRYCVLENDTTLSNCNFVNAGLPASYWVSATENAKVLSFWLKDVAGNVSNRVDTNSVTLHLRWASTTTSASNNSYFTGVSVDAPSGNVYTVGRMYGGQALGFGNSVTATGAYNGGDNAVIARYSATGAAQWAQTTSSASNCSSFEGVSVDASGNIYAAGSLCGSSAFNFGNGVSATGVSGVVNPIIVKYDSTGTTLWAKTITSSSSYAYFNNVAVDPVSSDIYAVGNIYGNAAFDFGGGITATGAYNGYNSVLVKYGSGGAAVWARTTSVASSPSGFESVSVDSDGNVYAVGNMSGTGTFGFGNGITAAGGNNNSNHLIVKYDSSGLAQWAKTNYTTSNDSAFYGVSIDASNNIYAVGRIVGAISFGDGVAATGAYNGGANSIIVKYNSAGLTQWASTTTSGANVSYFEGVSVAPSGSIYATGWMDGLTPFGFGNSISASGMYNGSNSILVKYSSAGVAQWAKTTSSASNTSHLLGVAAGASDSVYTAGDITGNAAIGFADGVTAMGAYNGSNFLLMLYLP